MDGPLFELVYNCTVRVTIPGGQGTGFFVAPGLILTCAHVVEAAKDKPTLVKVYYGNDEFAVKNIKIREKPYPDLALLQIDSSEHPCVYLDAKVQSGDELFAYGYTSKYPGGESATVKYEGPARIDNQKWLLKFKGGQIIPGYSGSPLLNTRTGNVCGMVKSTRDETTALGGGGIPTEVVLMELSELTSLQAMFHNQDSRWREAHSQQISSGAPQAVSFLRTVTHLPPTNGLVPPISDEEYPVPSCLNFYLEAPLGKLNGALKDRLGSVNALLAFICALIIYAGGIFAFRIYEGTPLPSSLSDLFLRIAPGGKFYYPDSNAIAFDFILNPLVVILSIFYHQAIYGQLTRLFRAGFLKVEDRWNQRLSSGLWVRTAIALPAILGVSAILCSWFSRYSYYIYDLLSFRLYVLLLIGVSTFLRTSLLISMIHSAILLSSGEINIPSDILNLASKRQYRDLGDSSLLLNSAALLIFIYAATTIFTSIMKRVPLSFDFLFWEAVIQFITVILILIYFNHWQGYVAAHVRGLKDKYIDERLGNETDASQYQAALALVNNIPDHPMTSSSEIPLAGAGAGFHLCAYTDSLYGH